MSIEIGQHVRSLDEKDLGTIRHLILDPTTGQVNTVVIEKGWLLPEDIEVPLKGIEELNTTEAQVMYTAEQVKDLPRFDASQYTSVPPPNARIVPIYPLGGLLWPGGIYAPALSADTVLPYDSESGTLPSTEAEEILRRQYENNTVISAGDDVLSLSGEKIGEVYSVAFDSTTGQPTSIRVRSGQLFHKDRDFPADRIDSVGNGVVYLKTDDAPTLVHH